MCISDYMVPSAIWEIFFVFNIFESVISRNSNSSPVKYEKRERYLLYCRKLPRDN